MCTLFLGQGDLVSRLIMGITGASEWPMRVKSIHASRQVRLRSLSFMWGFGNLGWRFKGQMGISSCLEDPVTIASSLLPARPC